MQNLIQVSHDLACLWLGNVNNNVYAKFDQNISCSSRVINIFTNCLWTELMLSQPPFIKKDCFACQWLGKVDMYDNAKFDINTPCGPRVKNIFTLCLRMELVLSKASSIKKAVCMPAVREC